VKPIDHDRECSAYPTACSTEPNPPPPAYLSQSETKLPADPTRESRTAAFELYRDRKNEYRWRLRAGNGRTIADSGEGYQNRVDCEHGIDLVRTVSDPEFYRDAGGGHRSRLKAGNGRTIADSGESYATAAGCRRSFTAVRRSAPQALVKTA
jgi:uncharacterized protein YegP (UPF0339 family)